MPETLIAFRQRTSFVWDSLPASGSFVTNPKLTAKVDRDGRLLPFCGDTVIFPLGSDDRAWLRGIQQALYGICGALLAEPLPEEGFHITLHDLNSAPTFDEIATAMNAARDASLALLSELGSVSVEVRSTAVFSMVNTSVVLGFEPVDEANCEALMTLYERFQAVVPLDHPLTPHVTLAYDRPGNHGEAGLFLLREAMDRVNRGLSPRTMRLTSPQYCRFSDMRRFVPA